MIFIAARRIGIVCHFIAAHSGKDRSLQVPPWNLPLTIGGVMVLLAEFVMDAHP